MPLSNIKEVEVCDANKNLLRDKEIKGVLAGRNGEGFIDLNALPSSEAQMVFLASFVKMKG